jgi:PAS domain S-box-containing protein
MREDTGAAVDEPVNILIVDDRPGNLTALEASLALPGYNLILARSGHEALAQVLRHELAVILLDVAMPRMDGFETAAIIKEREQSRHIPIVFVTASYYEMDHIFEGYTVGAVDYLRKPLDPNAVRAKVAVFVELYRQRKQLERQAKLLREAEHRERRLLAERAGRAAREREPIWRLAFEQAPVGMGLVGSDGRWLRANARLRRMLGHDGDELIGRSLGDLAQGDELRELASAFERVRSGADARSSRAHELVTARGEPLRARVAIAPLDGDDAPADRWVVVVVVDDRG